MFEVILRERDSLPFEVVKWFDTENKPFDKSLKPAIAAEALAASSAALSAVTDQFAAAHGTALGLHREAGFIGSDIDIDYTMPQAAFTPDIIDSLEAAGMPLIRQLNFDGKPAGLSFVYKRLKIDLGLLMPDGEGDRLVQVVRWRDGGLFYDHAGFDSTAATIAGITTRMPADIDSYVIKEYGPNWHRPVTYWHPTFCNANLYRIEGPAELLQRAGKRLFNIRMEALEKTGHI